jgi:hypothetical protein
VPALHRGHGQSQQFGVGKFEEASNGAFITASPFLAFWIQSRGNGTATCHSDEFEFGSEYVEHFVKNTAGFPKPLFPYSSDARGGVGCGSWVPLSREKWHQNEVIGGGWGGRPAEQLNGHLWRFLKPF